MRRFLVSISAAVVLVAITAVVVSPQPSTRSRLAASTTPTLVVVGDSITAGSKLTDPGRTAWPSRVANELVGFYNVQNDAHGGQCVVVKGCGYPTSAILTEFPSLIAQPGVKVALIGGGTNDLGHFTPATGTWWQLPGAFYQMMNDCTAAGVTCYLETIPPMGKTWPWRATTEAQRQAVNTWMVTNYPTRTIQFSAVLSNATNELWTEYCLPSTQTSLDLHPNWIGEVRMADMVPVATLRSLVGFQGG